MDTHFRNKGPAIHRFLTLFFSAIFAILCYWLLGFVVDDIGTWPGPTYTELEVRRLDQNVVKRADDVQRQIDDTQRRIVDQKARQELLRDSTVSSQSTMNQLLEFQRLNLEKNVSPSADERRALADSQQRFLANQRQYQVLNEDLVRLNEQQRQLSETFGTTERELARLRTPINEEFASLRRAHDLKVAAFKLGVLIPLLALGVFLFVKYRNSLYGPMIYAFGAAVMLRVGLVMHQYFPSRYFKYVLILTAIGVVFRILHYLLRMVAFPRPDWLLKQYREAYEAFLCPTCSYPIRRGPLKYMSWTRRTIKKMSSQLGSTNNADEPYTCPMCSTRLYEECGNCRAVRPSLLPSCQQCGQIRTMAGFSGTSNADG
jgi:hypothetical protein